MNDRKKENHCIIIGAGLTGLMAAAKLHEAGLKVTVVERASQVGGRMIPVRMNTVRGAASVFDCGAQFFTVREPLFEQLVVDWLARGLVGEWSRGFATADGSYYADGHPRYRGLPDMGAIARDLANGLDVRLKLQVEAVTQANDGWQLELQDGQTLTTGALILTPPVPHSLALTSTAGLFLDQNDYQRLSRINYEPCIALLIQLNGPGQIPEPGGMWPIGEPIAWLADNYRKGVSPVPGAITIHAGPEFSDEHWLLDDPIIVAGLLTEVDDWLGATVKDSRVIRWQYSKPFWCFPDPFLAISEPAPLIFAGDAFAGPRVEGAALSGLAAADWLLNR